MVNTQTVRIGFQTDLTTLSCVETILPDFVATMHSIRQVDVQTKTYNVRGENLRLQFSTLN